MGNKGILVAIALLSLVLASGCLSSEPIDCGTDEACFADALSECAEATVKTGLKVESFGVIDLRYILSGSVVGVVGDSCVFETTFEEIAMVGNLTQAPSRLILHLFNLTGSPIRCIASGPPIGLDIGSINQSAGLCSGVGLDILKEALRYKEGEPPLPEAIIKVEEAFCVGGERIVLYVRNMGLSDINISDDMKLLDADSGEQISVEWWDFTGSKKIGMLYPLQMSQTEIGNLQAGLLYGFEISLGEDSYPFSVQC